jgi:hypothetical protein
LLRTDEAVEQGDGVSVSDRDVAGVRLRPADAEQVAVTAEDRSYVAGEVREEVAGILVLGGTSTREHCAEAIDGPTSVRVDQPTDELPWVPTCDGLLPPCEDDRPFVLANGSVLRKGERQVTMAALDDDCRGVAARADVGWIVGKTAWTEAAVSATMPGNLASSVIAIHADLRDTRTM